MWTAAVSNGPAPTLRYGVCTSTWVGGYGDHHDVAVPAGRVVVDVAGHHHDVVGDRGQRHELLDPANLESVTRRANFGLDDLQVGAAGLLGRADAQHGFAADGLFADRAQMIRLAEPAQDARSPSRAGSPRRRCRPNRGGRVSSPARSPSTTSGCCRSGPTWPRKRLTAPRYSMSLRGEALRWPRLRRSTPSRRSSKTRSSSSR